MGTKWDRDTLVGTTYAAVIYIVVPWLLVELPLCIRMESQSRYLPVALALHVSRLSARWPDHL